MPVFELLNREGSICVNLKLRLRDSDHYHVKLMKVIFQKGIRDRLAEYIHSIKQTNENGLERSKMFSFH